MVRASLLALACAFLPSGASARVRETAVIRVTFEAPDTCLVRVAASSFDLYREEAPLRAALKAEAGRHRIAQIETDALIPYRCFGGALFLAQGAGFKDVGFVAEPPPAGEKAALQEGE
jgi:hypothetical protein